MDKVEDWTCDIKILRIAQYVFLFFLSAVPSSYIRCSGVNKRQFVG